MPDHPTAESSERELVAERLSANGDRIVAGWMKAVAADAGIPSADQLTITALRDHFPEMLRELVASVRVPRKSDDGEARETGSAHGNSRWRSGYRLDEVLRELARIREMVLEDIHSICRAQVSEGVRDDVIKTARIYFDTISATSARQFVRAQDAEVILRTNQLEHAYEQVQAATQQMRSIAESRLSLLRAATHELRNAMQPVTLAAETLLEESNLKNRDEIGRQLASVACRLQALLDRLVKLSSLLSGEARVQLVPVAFSELLGNLEREYRPIAEKKGLQFLPRLSVAFAEIISDQDKLHEIGEILLSNAIEHTTAGSVCLEVVYAEPHRWVLRVTDTGSGIDPIDAHHIFNEFHSRNSAASGLRLGLIIARHLARLLGGEITFQSTIGEGSRFEVDLPRISPEV